MANQLTDKNNSTQVMVHDINSSISALQGAMEVITDEWRSNPELVEKVAKQFLPSTQETLLFYFQFL